MHELHDVLDRLERLERANRRWRRGSALLGLTLLLAVGAGFARPQERVLEARELRLTAPDGGASATLGFDAKGYPNLLLRKESATVVLTANGGLNIRGDDGRRGAFLGIEPTGAVRLDLKSERFLDGVRAAVHPDGSSGVYVLNAEGRERAAMEFLAQGASQVTTRDDRGRVRGLFGLGADGVPSLVLLDEVGRRRLGMLIEKGEQGTPLLAMDDPNAVERFRLSMEFDGAPLLQLNDEKGQPSFRAP